jgi:hypothetical protein
MQVASEKRWVVSASLLVGAVGLLLIGRELLSPAGAHVTPQISGDGRTMIVPVQLGRDNYGLAMVDTVAQTLWIYELSNRGPAYSRLKLSAARSWKYDRMLERYNTAEPYPEQVRLLIEKLGPSRKQQGREGQGDSSKSILEMVTPDQTNSALER